MTRGQLIMLWLLLIAGLGDVAWYAATDHYVGEKTVERWRAAWAKAQAQSEREQR